MSYQAARKLAKPLIEAFATQTTTNFFYASETAQLWREIHSNNHHAQEFDNLYPSLLFDLQRCVELVHEKGSSSWLPVVPVEFLFEYSDFHDVIYI